MAMWAHPSLKEYIVHFSSLFFFLLFPKRRRNAAIMPRIAPVNQARIQERSSIVCQEMAFTLILLANNDNELFYIFQIFR